MRATIVFTGPVPGSERPGERRTIRSTHLISRRHRAAAPTALRRLRPRLTAGGKADAAPGSQRTPELDLARGAGGNAMTGVDVVSWLLLLVVLFSAGMAWITWDWKREGDRP